MEETGTFKWLAQHCLGPISVAVFTLVMNLALSGCRDKASEQKSPSTQAVSEAPETAETTADVTPAPLDPFDLPGPAAPAQRPIQRRIEEADVTLAGSNELAAVIAEAQVVTIEPEKLAGPAAEALRRARESGFILGRHVFDITPPAPYDHGQYLPNDLQLALPLTPEQCSGATEHNVGVVYLSARGPIYLDGYYDRARSAVVVEVPHLSGFLSFRRDPMKEITQAIADEASRRAWGSIDETRKKLEEKLIESAEDYLKKQAFDKLDGGIKRKILVGLVSHRDEVGNLFSASGSKDVAGFCQTFQLLMGKIIVDNVPASGLRDVLKTVTESTDTIEAVSQAGGQAAGGDYWAAVEILGKAYAQTTPIYQYTVQAAAIMDAGWSMLKDDALETFYQEYKADTFVPERVTKREDILLYLKRKFPKPGGGRMTDAEVAQFVLDNFAQRLAHEKETAQWEADLKKIYEWYSDRPLIKSMIRERFNNPNQADCFRRFLRILDAIDKHLVQMGICRSPWAPNGNFMPQVEMVELVNAFSSGGAGTFNRKLEEIKRRLAKPLDLEGYTGYWTLAETKRTTVWTRSSVDKDEYQLEAESERTGPHTYVGSVKLRDTYIKDTPDDTAPEYVHYTYEAAGTIAFDDPPSVVPNGANWDVMLRVALKETCSSDWAGATQAISYRLGGMHSIVAQGKRPYHANCYAAILRAEKNRVRVRQADDLAPGGPTHFSAANGAPWRTPVPVRFTLIPSTTKSTSEQFILVFEAATPAGTFREEHVYQWTRDLPKKLEPELHRQISRANYQGVRSDKPDMSAAVQAKTVEAPKPTPTVANSKTRITQLRYVPEQLVAMKQAAFEVTVENGPKVPSFAWSFDKNSPASSSWTTIPQCKFTYFNPGTYTITVKMRDKNNYAKGNLATGTWEVTVVSEKDASDTTAAPPTADQKQLADETPKDQDDKSVQLRLTYPAGQSPKVFTSGWVFGAECLVANPNGQPRDLSDSVRWSGSGEFFPPVGSRSRPLFITAGTNRITLTVQVGDKSITKTFPIVAVSPNGYACVGGQAHCPADSHGCPACPHDVVGPIQTGSPLITIGGKPAARQGDTGIHAACCGPNTFEIVGGDPDVLIDGRPAARLGSPTKHCGGNGTITTTGH